MKRVGKTVFHISYLDPIARVCTRTNGARPSSANGNHDDTRRSPALGTDGRPAETQANFACLSFGAAPLLYPANATGRGAQRPPDTGTIRDIVPLSHAARRTFSGEDNPTQIQTQ